VERNSIKPGIQNSEARGLLFAGGKFYPRVDFSIFINFGNPIFRGASADYRVKSSEDIF
jgi:hypothetical protein